MALDSGAMIAYRRITDPVQIPVSPVPSKFDVPAGMIPAQANSFYVINPNAFWIRLKGSYNDPGYVEVVGADGQGTGWLFQPGFSGIFTTQFPNFMSVVAVSKQGIPAGTGFIEMSWGMGT